MVVDGKEHEQSLFKMVMSTQEASNQNNVIKFSDNSRYTMHEIVILLYITLNVSVYSECILVTNCPSSAINGYDVKLLGPENPAKASVFEESNEKRHIIFTAETHNFPTGYLIFIF